MLCKEITRVTSNLPQPTSTPIPKYTKAYSIVIDSGATDTFLSESYANEHSSKKIPTNPSDPKMLVAAANGEAMTEMGKYKVHINGLKEQQGTALAEVTDNILSLAKVCEQGNIAVFDADTVKIYDAARVRVEGTPDMIGHRNQQTGWLYKAGLDNSRQIHVPMQELMQHNSPTHAAMAVFPEVNQYMPMQQMPYIPVQPTPHPHPPMHAAMAVCETGFQGEELPPDRQVASYPRSRVPNMSTFYAGVNVQSKAEWVAFAHAALGFPTVHALYEAQKCHLKFPGLTAADILENPPKARATAKGHLRQVIQGLHSTKEKVMTTRQEDIADIEAERSLVPGVEVTSDTHTKITDNSGHDHDIPRDSLTISIRDHKLKRIYADTTGKFHETSARGNNYVMFLYHTGTRFIKMVPISNRSEVSSTIENAIIEAKNLGHQIEHLFIDNEVSAATKEAMMKHRVVLHQVAAYNHRANAAERAIQTGKAHIISTLAGANPACPKDAWDYGVIMAQLTLSLIRSNGDGCSTYEAYYRREFDWNATPLIQWGIGAEAFVPKDIRSSWANRSTDTFYLGPAPNMYRTHMLNSHQGTSKYIFTRQQCVWLPHNIVLPKYTEEEHIKATMMDCAEAWTRFSKGEPQANIGIVNALKTAAQYIQPKDNPNGGILEAEYGGLVWEAEIDQEMLKTPKGVVCADYSKVRQITEPNTRLEGVEKTILSSNGDVEPDANSEGALVGEPEPDASSEGAVEEAEASPESNSNSKSVGVHDGRSEGAVELETNTGNRNAARVKAHSVTPTKPKASQIAELDTVDVYKKRHKTSPKDRRKRQRANLIKDIEEASGQSTSVHEIFKIVRQKQLQRVAEKGLSGSSGYERLNVITHEDHKKMNMNQARKSLDSELWIKADEVEFAKFCEIDGVEAVCPEDYPLQFLARDVVKVLEHKAGKPHRCRAAINGKALKGQEVKDMYAAYSSTPLAKRLFWQIGANYSKKYGAVHTTFDLKSFYLHFRNLLDRTEYFYYPVGHMSKEFTGKHRHLIQNGRILMKTKQAIYGIRDAGSVAGKKLAETLSEKGYIEIQNSCIWKSTKEGEHALLFNINVDDFGIIHDPKTTALTRLQGVLKEVGYEYTEADPNDKVKEFCGLHVHHDIDTHAYTISMPGAIDKMLKRFNMAGKVQPHPYGYQMPDYSKKQTATPDDLSKPLTPLQRKELQEKLGVCRWIIDNVIPALTFALGRVACKVGNPTVQVLREVNRLIMHMAGTQNPAIKFKPTQNMQLGVFSDASFSSEQRSRSRIGGVLFIGGLNKDNEPETAAIQVISEVSNIVADSAAEAEYIAVHAVMKRAVHIRYILEDLGFAQDTTIHRCDNKCAVGLANKTTNDKRTKHIHRRIHWVQDQTELSIFNVIWEPGSTNIADFFTKPMSKKEQEKMSQIFGLQCDSEGMPIAEEGVLGLRWKHGIRSSITPWTEQN